MPPVMQGGTWGGADFRTAWIDNMSPARRGIFRYALPYGSGGGSVPINSFAFTFGINSAWVGAHELGHGMGLGHSGPSGATGDVDPNCKPNYTSLMNYAFDDGSVGFADGIGAAPLNNSSLTEWEAVPPTNTAYLDVLEQKFKYWVDRQHGHVDWNRDGLFASAVKTVRAYANFRPGQSCEYTRYNRTRVTGATSTQAPAMEHLQDRLYVFYSVLGSLKYTYSTSSWDCPTPEEEGCAGGTWADSEWAYMDAPEGVDVVRIGGRQPQLLVVTVDAEGGLWEARLSLNSRGQEVWTTPSLIPNASPAAGAPSLARMSACETYLAYKGTDSKIRFNRLTCASGWEWEGEQLALTPSGVPIAMADYASPAINRTYLPWRPGLPALYGALANENGYLEIWWFNNGTGRWEKTNVLESTPPQRVEGRPAMAWVPAQTSAEYPGRFYLMYVNHDMDDSRSFGEKRRLVRMLMSYVQVTETEGDEIEKTEKVGLNSPFDNTWHYAYGIDLLYKSGTDTNLRYIRTAQSKKFNFQLWFRPKADGIQDFTYTNYDDWEVLRVGLCRNVVNPGGLVDDPITCVTPVSRATEIINDHINSPYPDPNSSEPPERCLGRAAYALAAYYTNTNIITANDYINYIHAHYNVPSDTSQEFTCYWALPLLWRIYLEPTMNSRLSELARDNLENMMWRYIEKRSKVVDSNGSVWIISMSENHDAVQKAHYFLAAQALRNAGSPYSPSMLLADGYTLENHYTGWQSYWKEYFRQRAREGINVEVASPTYAKYTLYAYYNIHDFAHSSILRRLAKDFLNLYWADVANDYLAPTGIRGGAMVRVYKDKYLTRGSYDSLRQWSYMYGWHDTDSGPNSHPAILVPATSPYRVPALIHALAIGTKPPYQYISRRFGMGTHTGDGDTLRYTISFDPGNASNLRRYTYITPDYVMGTMIFNPDKTYTKLTNQNRWMGVIFADNVESRLVVHGLDPVITRTGYSEITGAAFTNCMVVGRDPNADESIGMRIFISYGALWENMPKDSNGVPITDDGWLFTRAENAYAGIRIANGGYVKHSVEDGKMLDLPDLWSPIVIQLGQASNYASFTHFKDSVKANPFSYYDGKLTYISENDDSFEFWSNGGILPKINGTTPSLNPAKTYSSPYILGYHGEDTVTLHYPGYERIVLDFSY